MGFYARKRREAFRRLQEIESRIATGQTITDVVAREYLNCQAIVAMRHGDR